MSNSLNDRTETPTFHDLNADLEKLPGQAPSSSPTSSSTSPSTPSPDDLQSFVPLRVPTLTNSPGCAPRKTSTSASSAPTGHRTSRRVRPVRTDAWSEPVAVNWSRTRSTVRKVSRKSPSTDWALPF